MSRIVIVRSNHVDPDSRVEKEANSLSQVGHEVILVTWDRSENYIQKIDEKCLKHKPVKRVSFGARAGFGEGFKSFPSFIKFQISLFLWLLKNKNSYDICHFCDFDTAFTGSHACKLLNKKYVFDIFDYLSTDEDSFVKKIVKKAENKIIDHADATIICTEDRINQIAGTNPKNLVVIHNSPEKIQFSDEGDALVNHKLRIAYVGILQEHRMLKEIVHAVSIRNDVELYIGGFGKFEGYMRDAADRYDNIFYFGKLSYDQTLKIEQNCDIITAIYDPEIGNHRYAAPNKFYEGLMLGKPLIMVRNTGMSNIVEEYNLGEIIDFTEESFDRALDRMIDRKDEWQEIGCRMRKIYDERFSWNQMEKRLQDMYMKMI